MSDIRLIVGLGNPGPEYQNTRHNAGSWVVEQLARQSNIPLKADNKFFGLTGRGIIAGQDVRLLIPTTYMNKSGQSVGAVMQFYKLQPENLLVAFDELDLEPGIIKFKVGGSSSQNGIRDIVKALGNNKEFLRLRVGIGHPGSRDRVTGHVLGKASAEDQNKMDAAIDEALRCIDILFKQDIKAAMNRLHSFKG
ncbi:aminoacyl-tRNA hydrolase [Planctobacterium marinum]|uniref:aminoacyl-tRNA hydrolase n=1 Tax=Planctobacterium marinum TaxID=1631968 RepID=UPI001E363E25|nr:aminoacyl-tRNA hydrolase [Planctobacterium marinum]MCC2604331.1 aminoacyl-tRNA hydrolase [Planctobacterium marinum]